MSFLPEFMTWPIVQRRQAQEEGRSAREKQRQAREAEAARLRTERGLKAEAERRQAAQAVYDRHEAWQKANRAAYDEELARVQAEQDVYDDLLEQMATHEAEFERLEGEIALQEGNRAALVRRAIEHRGADVRDARLAVDAALTGLQADLQMNCENRVYLHEKLRGMRPLSHRKPIDV